MILLHWPGVLAQARPWVPTNHFLPIPCRALPGLSGEPVTLIVVFFPWLLLSLLLARKRPARAGLHCWNRGSGMVLARYC